MPRNSRRMHVGGRCDVRRSPYAKACGDFYWVRPAGRTHFIADQVAAACSAVERHLAATLQAFHRFGLVRDGGLKPRSNIDWLVTVDASE